MKKFLALFLLVLITVNANASTKIDPAILPITAKELSTEIKKNSRDATKVTSLLRRANESQLSKEAFVLMDRLHVQEPDNPVVLAGFCLAYDVRYWKTTVRLKRDAKTNAVYRKCLKSAYALAPRLWMTYMVEGYGLVLNDDSHLPYKERERGLSLVRKAIRLAPQNAYPQYALGSAYYTLGLRSSESRSPQSLRLQRMRKAVYHFENALRLQPPVFHAAFELFEIADEVQHERKKAVVAAKLMVAMLPPGKKVSQYLQSKLGHYGIKVDAYP